MIYAVRNEGETNDKLILRYKKLFFQSRISNKLKTERYVVKNETRKKRREKAIIRETYRSLQNKVYF
ncbi:hypothetical protein H3C61_00385 [Candidatus Gracilibacteria bacterium]|nr:hypothetical protein [Candidatus Gracilibacteria bacterium]